MSIIYSKKTVYIILVGAVFFIAIFFFIFTTSGWLLFGNIINSAKSSYFPSEKTIDQRIPEFYRTLKKEKENFSIIEYPVIIQDRYNPIYYYQSYHRKKILKGYFLSHALKKQWRIRHKGNVSIWPVEIMLSLLENNKINFSKIINLFHDFIDLYDIPSIRNSGAKYIILHKNIKDESLAVKDSNRDYSEIIKRPENQVIWNHIYNFSSHFKEFYKRYFGEPLYENYFLIVFQIK
ncbi:MAG: hypothetical protein V3U02_05395 [Calditrichia bacterium]